MHITNATDAELDLMTAHKKKLQVDARAAVIEEIRAEAELYPPSQSWSYKNVADWLEGKSDDNRI
jgi:hypothetical protein